MPLKLLEDDTVAASEEADLETTEDEELVQRCRAELPHDTRAFQLLVHRYEGLVFNTCAKMLGSVPDAEEVSQDVFLRVFHKLHQFEGRSSFKTWLFSIVYNQCLSRRKRLALQRGREVALETSLPEAPQELPDLTLADQQEKVREAINHLKPEDREVIVARFISDLSLEQIAELLQLKLSAAKMRLYRAMERFKEVYSQLPLENETSEKEVPSD